MPTNKELEKRVNVLEEQLVSLAKMLVDIGKAREQEKTILDNLSRDIKRLSEYSEGNINQPYISFKWNSARRLWRTQLVNASGELENAEVHHDSPAQALQMLLQKLQQRVS